MPKTIRRSPYSVSTSSGDYPTRQTFNQVEFKGIQCGSNELAVDQSSFADAENVYLDRDYNLASRPPLKNDEPYKDLLKKWMFGNHSIHVEKYYTKDAGFINRISNVYELSDDEFDNIYCTFGICYKNTKTGKAKSKYFHYKATDVGWEYTPPMNCALVGDKIFIWFAGKEFICYNIASEAFEDATQYIYTPIHKQVVNGFESDLETKNFLTSAYKKRYQYSALITVDFNMLDEQDVEVRLLGDARTGTNTHLYDVTLTTDSAPALIYPTAYVGNYDMICVKTARTPVFLRYNENYTEIAISFDGKYFRILPYLHDVISEPILSEDGFCAIAFTARGVARCSIDTVTENEYVWDISPYCELVPNLSIDEIRYNFRPRGAFASRDDFAYVLEGVPSNISDDERDIDRLIIYSEYIQDGVRMWAYTSTTRCGIDILDTPKNQTGLKISFSSLTELKMVITFEMNDVAYATSNYKWALFSFVPTYVAAGSTINQWSVVRVNVINGVTAESNSTLKLRDFTLEAYRGPDGDEDGVYVYSRTISTMSEGLYLYEQTSHFAKSGVLCRVVSSDSQSYSTIKHDGPIVIDRSGTRLATTSEIIILNEDDLTESPSIVHLPITADKIVSGIDNHPWYLIDGELWTSQPTEDNTLLLDLAVLGEYNLTVPDHWRELNEHYFVFNASHKLEITQHRLSNGIPQLYLPEYNSQTLANNITNLWPLTDTIMGVFTAHELYYINAITMDDASIVYTKLLKSKTQIGCRDGDDIIIGPDGQTILLPTPRGITAMNASMLLDTSSQTLSYLTDPIATIYKDFYIESVSIPRFDARYGSAVPERYDAAIKIVKHDYLILFYKYMDKTILVFDTRNSSWWRWRVQYPIRQITNENISSDVGRIVDGLIFWLNIDYTPYDDTGQRKSRGGLYLPTKLSDFGTKFKFDPDADYIHPLRGPTRKDDIVDGAVTYVSRDYSVPENLREYGTPPVVEYGDPKIRWHVTSQRLHFGAINNYKCVKSFGVMAKADGPLQMKLQMKAYRDFYHPEYSELFEVNINEQRTFFRKMNMMHLTNFQYTFSNTDDEYENTPLKLNSICIKYEVKEAIR